MARLIGQSTASTQEFRQLYDKQLAKKGGRDPIVVLFDLLKSRKQGIKLNAAKELLSYRFPKQASIQATVEQAGQLLLSWDEVIDLPPEHILELDPVEALKAIEVMDQ